MHALADESAPEYHYLSPAPGMLDVLPAGWTKASGVRFLKMTPAPEFCTCSAVAPVLAPIRAFPQAMLSRIESPKVSQPERASPRSTLA